jgi:hypothetical protein
LKNSAFSYLYGSVSYLFGYENIGCFSLMWHKSWEKKEAKGSGKPVSKNNQRCNCVFRESKPRPNIKR